MVEVIGSSVTGKISSPSLDMLSVSASCSQSVNVLIFEREAKLSSCGLVKDVCFVGLKLNPVPSFISL